MKKGKVKKYLFLLAVCCLTAALSGCSDKTSETGADAGLQKDTKIIRVAFNQSEEHPEYLAMKEFGEKFSKATDGAYEVEIYPNAVMGDQGAVTELVRTGALDMAIVPVSVPEGYNSDFAIISAPYLYDNVEQMRRAAEEGVFNQLFETTKKFHFEVVTLYTSGARHIYADKPILSPEDLKGYKIRVMDSDTYIQMMDKMGGLGTAMSQGEVYTAIQQKVIEGGENSERVYADFKHYEVAPCFSYTNHLVMADVVVANEDFLNDMSKETRELFNQYMEESMVAEFDLWNDAVEEGKKTAEENGAQFYYPDLEPFKENCKPLLEKVANQSEMTKEIYQNVEALKKEMEGETNE